ncbi:mannose-6-phosphate isomerase, class I [uncultured Desulfosarcina sp.]|uniref:mannose-6-phosphate isomerase, class I n=1 Tax=uncultured Desulfosarcina sp. TaxID=218289 RepID=UPI0029C64417|nr:mannose-6-phosphate isomerase, class I [uncultured Desulfosarcina sp.]
MQIYRLENVIQPYAWGSRTAIAELTGQPVPSAQPQAELWMGTHSKGPSTVLYHGERLPLQRLIQRHPFEILGKSISEKFDGALPCLFKVLAAAQPLSIQAHPDKSRAVEGFERENRSGIPLDASNRNYRDNNHKPEIICALTPFWGLNGFRPFKEIHRLMAPVCPKVIEKPLQGLLESENRGLKDLFETMMRLSADQKASACAEITEKAVPLKDSSPVYEWMIKLAGAYPGDLGILSPALLNLIRLKPGQAMYLPAGQLHAYLDGVGIELMANSDNVLRGGLTPKHVDVDELLRVVRFTPTPVDIIQANPLRPGEAVYPCPAEEFALGRINATPDRPYVSSRKRSVELLLCTSGKGTICCEGSTEVLAVARGDSLLVPAGLSSYTLSGEVTVYKASVPLPHADP